MHFHNIDAIALIWIVPAHLEYTKTSLWQAYFHKRRIDYFQRMNACQSLSHEIAMLFCNSIKRKRTAIKIRKNIKIVSCQALTLMLMNCQCAYDGKIVSSNNCSNLSASS